MKYNAIQENNIPEIYSPISKKDTNKYVCPDKPALPKAWKKTSEEQKCWEDPQIVSNCAFLSGIVYDELGFREFHPTINVGGTHCVLSQSPKDQETLYISICGTKGKTDILTDLDVDHVSHPDWAPRSNVKVHKGFLKRSLEILAELDTAIHQSLDQGCSMPKKIILTGHSLSGALSSLIHIELVRRASLKGIDISNITFWAPLFGNMAWWNELKKLENSDQRYSQMYHFVNSEDIVPGAFLNEDHVFKNLRSSLLMLPRMAKIPGLSGMVKNQLKKRTGAETPEQAKDMDDLYEKIIKHFNWLRDPAFTQPIFNAEYTNDLYDPVYVPVGNFK